MSLIEIRKRALNIETVFHEGGPPANPPLRMGSAIAVMRKPLCGSLRTRSDAPLWPSCALGHDLAQELADALGRDQVEAYGKAAIVGVDGELEHGAAWHEGRRLGDAGGARRTEGAGPGGQAVAATGYRRWCPLHCIHACYVRSHYNAMEIGMQDAPRPREILYEAGHGHRRAGALAPRRTTGQGVGSRRAAMKG